MLPKKAGALLSVGLNAFLILLKLTTGLVTGSVGVLASAIDSIVDLIASVLAYFAVHIADTPPDADHPFGHSKFEDFAGLVQGILIMIGAIAITWQATEKLMHPHAYATVQPLAGIVVMVISLVMDGMVSAILFRISRQTESVALNADAQHLHMDVWTSIAVITGLILVKVTGKPYFDSIVAIGVAVAIFWVGLHLVRSVFNNLVDAALPPDEANTITSIITSAMPAGEPFAVDALRARRSGSHRLIVFNLLVSPHLSVQKAHDYCDTIENALEKTFPNSLVNIHLEPLS